MDLRGDVGEVAREGNILVQWITKYPMLIPMLLLAGMIAIQMSVNYSDRKDYRADLGLKDWVIKQKDSVNLNLTMEVLRLSDRNGQMRDSLNMYQQRENLSFQQYLKSKEK